jgi:hypothetical protein
MCIYPVWHDLASDMTISTRVSDLIHLTWLAPTAQDGNELKLLFKDLNEPASVIEGWMAQHDVNDVCTDYN